MNVCERTKLDAKSKKCPFIGYNSDEFGFWFFDENSHKVIRNWDIVFNEQVLYKDRGSIFN